jgi:hypothetical protein
MVSGFDSKYILIYPFPFGEFLWEKHELSELSEFVEVEVWDLSNVLHRKWKRKLQTPGYFKCKVLEFYNFTDFYRHLNKFRLLNKKKEIYISWHVPGITLKEFLITQFIKLYLKRVETFYINNSLQGIPVSCNVNRKFLSLTWFRSEFRKFASNPINFIYRFKSLIFETLSSKFKVKFNYHLVSGESYKKIILNQLRSGTKIINAHSLDCSNYLRRLESCVPKKSSDRKSIIFLDIGFPYSASDLDLTHQKTELSSTHWYQKLNDMFAILESQFNLKVIICGHYKTNYASPSQLFNGREVIYNRTMELVSNSQFVITIGSSAISYAVIHKKPIIFITSDAFKFSIVDQNIRQDFEQMAYELDSAILNLDHLPLIFEPLLKVNNEKYNSYFFKYMTSRRDTIPNFKIILKEIISLNQI